MSFASLQRWTLLAAVATTLLTGCAWAPGALFLDPWIHHRNYRAAKAAYYNYGRGDLGPWAPLCKDFETGWRQGYYDVANGMDGQRPIAPPRRYWAARYQSPAGQKQVEAWFAGYELGAAGAQRDGIGYWAFVPTSLGVPAQERIEEHGTVGYRVMPENNRAYTLDDRDVAHPEPVVPMSPERIEPRRARPPRTLPTPAPAETETETETPLPLPNRTAPRTTSPKPTEAPKNETPVEPALEPETTPTEEVTPPAGETEVPDEPADNSFDPFANPEAAPTAEDTPLDDTLPDAPLEEEPPVETPAAPAEEVEQPDESDDADALTEPPVEVEPADQGTGAPAIPRRDINWPPRPSSPRQPGQRAPVDGELPKGLDTDEPLPEDGAAIMRRPRPTRPSSVRTLAAGSGSNRLRLAPAEVQPARRLPIGTATERAVAKAAKAPAEAVTVSAEEPAAWSPRVQPAVHTEAAPATAKSVEEEPIVEEDQAMIENEEPDPSEVLAGLRQVTIAQQGEGEAAIISDSGNSALSADDLFSGLSELAEGDAE